MTNGDVAHGHYLHHHPHDNARRDVVHDHCTCGEDGDSGDDEVEFDNPDYRYAAPVGAANGEHGSGMMSNVQRRLMEAARVPNKPPPPGSTASSADGYESFENTSNKKKRKIPLSSASSMHQSQLSAEMASMGISGGADDDGGHGGGGGGVQHAGAGGNGTGISGAGRGRYGRQSGRSEYGVRRPLASSNANAINGYRNNNAAANGNGSRDLKGLPGEFFPSRAPADCSHSETSPPRTPSLLTHAITFTSSPNNKH